MHVITSNNAWALAKVNGKTQSPTIIRTWKQRNQYIKKKNRWKPYQWCLRVRVPNLIRHSYKFGINDVTNKFSLSLTLSTHIKKWNDVATTFQFEQSIKKIERRYDVRQPGICLLLPMTAHVEVHLQQVFEKSQLCKTARHSKEKEDPTYVVMSIGSHCFPFQE